MGDGSHTYESLFPNFALAMAKKQIDEQTKHIMRLEEQLASRDQIISDTLRDEAKTCEERDQARQQLAASQAWEAAAREAFPVVANLLKTAWDALSDHDAEGQLMDPELKRLLRAWSERLDALKEEHGDAL